MLAHTNKNRDSAGKVVFGGTSDIVDDVDCAFTLGSVDICSFSPIRSIFVAKDAKPGRVD